jgi:CheY-like chemotaxis protein
MAHILVVDDEPAIRLLIETIMEGEGHRVRTAGNGREALARIEEDLPDLIVLDLMMPEMDGWHFLEELHNRGLRKQTRVVIVSGYADSTGNNTRRLSRHYLAKPFDIESLISLVNDALEQDSEALYSQIDRRVSLARLIDKIDNVLR